MAEFVEVPGAEKLAHGKMQDFTVNGKPVLIAKIRDKYYATQGRCPHMGGVLAKGELNGLVVQCPRHGSQFNLKDGSVVRWMRGAGLAYNLGKAFKSPQPLERYEVKVDAGKVKIKIG